ncbi:MAG TPA: hypothetical protein EYP98_21475, partial [Planctomycetes bacterium]|nr:hypothetical protein [Planctomycetota bacterium]
KAGGRNNDGRITTRHIGGGHKQRYRRVDFRRRKFDVPGKIERLEYDPNRTAFIALVKYQDGELAYILAPQRLAVGDQVVAGEKGDVKPGNAMPLAGMPRPERIRSDSMWLSWASARPDWRHHFVRRNS